MSGGDPSRELQDRIARRLQDEGGQAPAVAARWLALECGGHGLLVPLKAAGEIFTLRPIVPVPRTQPWFAGLTNLRGAVHSVVDLAAFLGLPLTVPQSRSRLVALNAAVAPACALLVERVAGLRSPEVLQPDDTQVIEGVSFAGKLWRDDADRSWREIDLAALAAHERFLAAAA